MSRQPSTPRPPARGHPPSARHPLTPRKVPRIDLRKLEGGSPGDRRAAVATLGDALCALGGIRLEGAAGGPAAGEAAARAVLRGLLDYFGLPLDRLDHLVMGEGPWVAAEAETDEAAVAWVWSGDEALEVEAREGVWVPVGLRPGELLVGAGEPLQRLGRGVVHALRLRPAVGPLPLPDARLVMPAGVVLEAWEEVG